MHRHHYYVTKAEQEAEDELKYKSSLGSFEAPEEYDDVTWMIHLLEAANGPKALKFILIQAQFHLDLETQIVALERLINTSREILAENNFQEFADKIKQSIEKIFQLALENLSIFKSNQESVADVFNTLMAIFPEKQAVFKGKAATPMEALCYLSTGECKLSSEKKSQPVEAKNQEELFKLLTYNFEEFYTSGTSHKENFNQFVALFPTKEQELIRQKQIADEEAWSKFAKAVIQSVKNRDRSQFPRARLNQDGSVSFTILRFDQEPRPFGEENKESCPNCGTNCYQTCKETCNHFENVLNREQFQTMVMEQCQQRGFTLLAGKTKLLEVKNDTVATTNLIEYQLNLTPEQIDSLLKPQTSYAYRDEGSTLKLVKRFSLKEGMIRLAPAQVLDKDHSLLRAAGCQMAEMPSVQLRHLLPTYDGQERSFHWVPTEVVEQLSLDRGEIEGLLNQIFAEQKMVENRWIYFQSSEGAVVLANPQNSASPVKFDDMDEDTRNFYVMYGNCDAEELSACKSIEISTLVFLKYIRDYLSKLKPQYEAESKSEDSSRKEYASKKVEQLTKSLDIINTMIKTEETKIHEKSLASNKSAPLQAPHSAMFINSGLEHKTEVNANTTPIAAVANKK